MEDDIMGGIVRDGGDEGGSRGLNIDVFFCCRGVSWDNISIPTFRSAKKLQFLTTW